ncbi:uncharacterized protein isoform X2 [Rhodnius prolixus]|uniref:uncharacterized protein isoform X2 n=1 Tax=Rhodnius prolixus TaxID=13249 RepID=UPI003D18CDD8
MDLTRYRPSLHAHDFTPGGNSRVVMIRKKEQRTFNSAKIGQEPKFETLTKETVQTYRGNKIERKITSQTRGSQEISNELLKQLTLITIPGDNEKKKPVESVTSSITNQVNGERKKVSTPKKKEVAFVEADQFALQCLEAHNSKRALHKAPPLRLSKKLCKYSEEWARHLANRGEMIHRSESEYGENLFLVWSSSGNVKVDGSEPVENWYAEIKDHVFNKEPTTLKTGHFTQVIWMESEELGVGIATSKTGQVFVVCNYNPPGNFIGSFAENVPPIGGFTSPPKTLASEVRNDEVFQREMVKFHNEYRSRHGSPPLKINHEWEWRRRHLRRTSLVPPCSPFRYQNNSSRQPDRLFVDLNRRRRTIWADNFYLLSGHF